jgi:hypothetical protein
MISVGIYHWVKPQGSGAGKHCPLTPVRGPVAQKLEALDEKIDTIRQDLSRYKGHVGRCHGLGRRHDVQRPVAVRVRPALPRLGGAIPTYAGSSVQLNVEGPSREHGLVILTGALSG